MSLYLSKTKEEPLTTMTIDDFKALLQDTLLYIRPKEAKPRVSKIAIVKQEPPLPTPPPPIKESSPTPVVPPLKKQPPRPPSVSPMVATLKRIAPDLKLLSPSPSIVFITNEAKDEENFLRKVARALLASFYAAEVVTKSELKPLLTARTLKLIVAPLQTLVECFEIESSVEPHKIVSKWNGIALFALAPLAQYQDNTDLKRDLWTNLKQLSL